MCNLSQRFQKVVVNDAGADELARLLTRSENRLTSLKYVFNKKQCLWLEFLKDLTSEKQVNQYLD